MPDNKNCLIFFMSLALFDYYFLSILYIQAFVCRCTYMAALHIIIDVACFVT